MIPQTSQRSKQGRVPRGAESPLPITPASTCRSLCGDLRASKSGRSQPVSAFPQVAVRIGGTTGSTPTRCLLTDLDEAERAADTAGRAEQQPAGVPAAGVIVVPATITVAALAATVAGVGTPAGIGRSHWRAQQRRAHDHHNSPESFHHATTSLAISVRVRLGRFRALRPHVDGRAVSVGSVEPFDSACQAGRIRRDPGLTPAMRS